MKLARRLLRILISAVLIVSILVLPAAAATVNASPIQLKVLVDGTQKKFQAYMIGSNSYFRLRDVAYSLNRTPKQFDVIYDGLTGRTELISGYPYTPITGEMELHGSGESIPVTLTQFTVYLDGIKLDMTACVIGAYHYIKLRDLATAVDFGVTYEASKGAISIDTSTGYTPDASAPSAAAVTLEELNVTMIGDSIGVGIEPSLKTLIPKLVNDSKVSRQFYQAKDVVRELLNSGKLAQTVIIELGTNGTIKESDMRALIEQLGSGRKIVFVNCQVPRSWGAPNNAVIAKVVPDYPNTAIADWYGASLGQSGYLAKDGFHPSTTGAKVLAQLIADAVVSIQ